MKQGFTSKDRDLFGDDELFKNMLKQSNLERRTKEQYLKDFEDGTDPIPVTDDQVKWFEEAIAGLPDVKLPPNLHSPFFVFFTGYLKQMHRQGITEFRIAMQTEKHFVIYPLGKDGKTMDFMY